MKEEVDEQEEQHGLAAMLLNLISLIIPLTTMRPNLVFVRTRLQGPIDAADPIALFFEDPKARSCWWSSC